MRVTPWPSPTTSPHLTNKTANQRAPLPRRPFCVSEMLMTRDVSNGRNQAGRGRPAPQHTYRTEVVFVGRHAGRPLLHQICDPCVGEAPCGLPFCGASGKPRPPTAGIRRAGRVSGPYSGISMGHRRGGACPRLRRNLLTRSSPCSPGCPSRSAWRSAAWRLRCG